MDRRRLTGYRHVAMTACLVILATGSIVVAISQESPPAAQTPQQEGTLQPAPTSVPPPAPLPESIAAPPPVRALPPTSQPAPVAAPDGMALRLYMPDGQLISHRLSVYVTGNLEATHKPVLTLFRSHAVTARQAAEEVPLVPTFIASGQQWTETVDGQDVRQTGTILLFDGTEIPLGFRAMVRVRPALTWTEGNS